MSFEAIITSELEAAKARIIQRIQQQMFGGASAPASIPRDSKTKREAKLGYRQLVPLLVKFIGENPGANLKTIWPAFWDRTSKSAVQSALKRALASKGIQKRGDRAATAYFPVGHTIVGDQPKPVLSSRATNGNKGRAFEHIQKHPGHKPADVAKALGIGRQSAYRALYTLWQEGRVTESNGNYTAA